LALQADSHSRLLELMAEHPRLTWTLGILLIFALLIVDYLLRQQRRGRQLSAMAQQMGFSFSATDASLPGAGLGRLPWYSKPGGRSFLIQNVLRGSAGGNKVLVFDCEWSRGAVKGDPPPTQTVACFHLRGRCLPDFVVQPERALSKVGWLFSGYQDINLETSPEFSRRYLLRGPDQTAVRSVFTGELAECLGRERDWHILGSGEWVAMFHSKHGFIGVMGRPVVCVQNPKNIRTFVEQAGRIAELLAASAPGTEEARATPRPAVTTFTQEEQQLNAREKRMGERLGWIWLALIGLLLLFGLAKMFRDLGGP
jgi:hypothetical protein